MPARSSSPPTSLKVFTHAGFVPRISRSAYVHPTAVLIGDVIIGARTYIGPNAVLRGDNGPIRIYEEANIQDLCVVHGAPGNGTVVERRGHIGHGTTLHGCTVEENGFVGMNCVVLDDARVGKDAYVGAHSMLKAGLVIPSGMLAYGSPCKVAGAVSEALRKAKCLSTDGYVRAAAEAHLSASVSPVMVDDLEDLVAEKPRRQLLRRLLSWGAARQPQAAMTAAQTGAAQ